MNRRASETASFVLVSLVIVIGFAGVGSAGEVTVELAYPEEPCLIECELVNGGITVAGYDGHEVLVETRPRSRPEDEDDGWSIDGILRKIKGESSTLKVTQEDNHVVVETESYRRSTDVYMRVPLLTSVRLACVNDGEIEVEGISGELEVENVNGSIVLARVSGTVVAYAHNGDLTVEMRRVDTGKPMSFASWNGDVYVTLPADLKATFKMKTRNGDVHSDFQIESVDKPAKVYERNTGKKNGKYVITVEDEFYGAVNGGGPEFQFSTYNGDIVIRGTK